MNRYLKKNHPVIRIAAVCLLGAAALCIFRHKARGGRYAVAAGKAD